MPPRTPNRPPVKTNTRLPSPYSYTVMQNDDDDDICPVCESDCTCNANATLAPQQQLPQPPQTTQPLKIRLTLPPKLFSSLQNQKQTTSVAALDGGLAASANTDAIPPLPLPKKRGRPTKLEAEARRLAALRAAEHDNQQQRLTRPRTSRHAGPHIKSSIKKRQQVKTERRKSKKIVYPTSSTDSETEPRTSSFATFSSSFASTSKAAGLESDDSSSLSSLPDPGDESSLEAEEERYVIKQHEERMRMRQERQGGESENRRTSRNSWEQRAHARSASSGLGDRMDEDTDSDSDSEVEGEEEDGDADEEADEADGEGEMDDEEMFATRASVYESDDEEGDADLFFASLSDSDSSINGFDQVFEAPADDDSDDTPVESVVPVDRLDPLALFGHLSKGDLAAVFVKESESHYPFIDSGGFAMGMLDIDFELSVVAQQQRQSSQTGMFATDGIVVDDDEEMWIPTEEDEEEEQSDCGDTTDEDLVSMRGIHTPGGIVLFRVPTPPVSAIDPLSTLSPICKRKKSSAKKHKQFTKSKMSMTHAPKPHDILNKTTSIAHIPTEESPTADDTASVDGASSISWVLKQPVMGQFEKCDPTRQHIIINGENTESIPSPIGQVTRLRRGSGSSRGRKRSIIRDGSPFSIGSKGQARSPLPSRSRSAGLDDKQQHTSGRVTPEPVASTQSIDLSDVLDAALLDNLTDTEDEHQLGADGKYIGRWDRVPMGTFRRTRTAAAIASHLEPVLEWAPHQSSAVSDGFCYGSPGGSLMRSGPLFAAHDQSWHDGVTSSPTRGGDVTPTAGSYFEFGNTPPETPQRILSHKERRKEKRRQLIVTQP